MGIQGKRTSDAIRRFVVNTFQDSPGLSQREIADKVPDVFGKEIKIDKSNVGRILRSAGLGRGGNQVPHVDQEDTGLASQLDDVLSLTRTTCGRVIAVIPEIVDIGQRTLIAALSPYREGLRSEDPLARKNTIKELGEAALNGDLIHKDAIQLFQSHLSNEDDPQAQLFVIHALAGIGGPNAKLVLTEWEEKLGDKIYKSTRSAIHSALTHFTEMGISSKTETL